MNADDSYKQFKRCLAKRLALSKFASSRDLFWRKVHDTIVVVEVQRDRKYSTKDEIRFTINLGIAATLLLASEDVGAASSSPIIPPTDRCQWRQRIGHLLPEKRDVWWAIPDEKTAHALCDEIATALLQVVLPKVNVMASSESLVSAWQDGHGQGLTEYDRHLNLVRLLIALNRKDEAQAALRDFEKAAIGRSWEVSAACEAKELRARIN